MITVIAPNYRGDGKPSLVYINTEGNIVRDMPISPERMDDYVSVGFKTLELRF